MKNSRIYKVILFVCCLLCACKKPRNGDYIITETGNSIVTSCSTPTSLCTTSSNPYSNEREVKVKNSKKNSFMVDDDVWIKSDKNVSFHSEVTENYSPGAHESFTIDYSGVIKNKFLIEGTFTINSVYYSSNIIYQNSQGNFTIKNKKSH